MRHLRAFTLVETVVVIGIICSVAAISWMAIGPAAKARAIESTVRNDLRQLSIATHLYMSENDSELPLTMASLLTTGRPIPVKPTVVKSFLPGCGTGKPRYDFQRNESVIQLEKKYIADFPFDPLVNPIYKAPFFCRIPGVTEDFKRIGNGTWHASQRPKKLALGARLDGSVDWFPVWEQWQEEFAGKAHR